MLLRHVINKEQSMRTQKLPGIPVRLLVALKTGMDIMLHDRSHRQLSAKST